MGRGELSEVGVTGRIGVGSLMGRGPQNEVSISVGLMSGHTGNEKGKSSGLNNVPQNSCPPRTSECDLNG